jgi:hypothetical protein
MADMPNIRARVFKGPVGWYVEILHNGRHVHALEALTAWPTWRLAMLCALDIVSKRRARWAANPPQAT